MLLSTFEEISTAFHDPEIFVLVHGAHLQYPLPESIHAFSLTHNVLSYDDFSSIVFFHVVLNSVSQVT